MIIDNQNVICFNYRLNDLRHIILIKKTPTSSIIGGGSPEMVALKHLQNKVKCFIYRLQFRNSLLQQQFINRMLRVLYTVYTAAALNYTP